MTEEMKKQLHALKSDTGSLEQRRREISNMIAVNEKRMLEIRWNQYPIGSKITDKNGRTFQITGYTDYDLVGKLIKKDGSLGAVEQNIWRTDARPEDGR
jgi:hypothetical protein